MNADSIPSPSRYESMLAKWRVPKASRSNTMTATGGNTAHRNVERFAHEDTSSSQP